MPDKTESQPRDSAGRFARLSGLKQLAKRHRGLLTEATVMGAGTIGAQVGERMAGKVGEAAGEIVGALIARNLVHVGETALTARQKLLRDSAYQRATRLQRVAKLAGQTLSDLRDQHVQDHLGNELSSEIFGFAIGQGVNALGELLPGGSAIKMGVTASSAAASTVLTPKLVALRNRIRGKPHH